MNIAIVTMAYNENVHLPIWVRHYSKHCPGAALFVIDHGSDDGSTQSVEGVNFIPLPRSPFDDQTRGEFMADFQHALLRFYDVVICTDCDEMLVADPRKYVSLAAFLEVTDADVIAPTGLNVQHLPAIEPPIDLAAPILGQRRYVRFASGACKPSIARVPLLWMPGFHWCDRIPDHRTDIYQFHLRRMDITVSLERLQITRSLEWSERALRSWGTGQRQSDAERVLQDFEAPAAFVKAHGIAPFVFEADMRRRFESLRPQDGFYVGENFRGVVAEVPEAFFGLI
jgi:hypothetical protein